MPKKEPYNGEITPEKLREVLWADDFTKMPVRDPSEYNEKEAKLYKTVETYIKEHWDRIAKVLAGTYAPDAYSKDFPTEVLRTRFTAIVADNVIKLYFDKKRYRMLFDIFILPRLMKGSTGDEELHNVLNLAMQTMQVGEIAKIARRNSADEDFSPKSSRAKKDHMKRFGHSRSDTKMINYSELEDPESEISFLDTIADDDMEKLFDKIESDLAVEQICKGLSEREAVIFRGLYDGRPQQAIAGELGVSQSYISKFKVKLSKKLSEMYK